MISYLHVLMWFVFAICVVSLTPEDKEMQLTNKHKEFYSAAKLYNLQRIYNSIIFYFKQSSNYRSFVEDV